VLIIDGTRLEESFGDPAGWSDAANEATGDVMPAFRSRVLPSGTLVLPGYNTGIPITAPAHCALLTGAQENFAHYTNPGGPGEYRPTFPTLYEVLSSDHDEAEGALILGGNCEHLEALNHSVYPGATDASGAEFDLTYDPATVDSDRPGASNDDKYTLQQIRETLAAKKPELLVANLHTIDRAGHYGHYDDDDDPHTPDVYNPSAYADKVHFVDETLAQTWEWIQSDASGMKDTTMLVVMADHGRHRWGAEAAERSNGDTDPDYKNHGDQCSGCREIPMFLAGPGIKQGATVTTHYTIEDVSRTIARVLGVQHPYSSGLVMNDIFEAAPGGDDRQGAITPSASGSEMAWQQWNDDPDARSQVEIDGEVVSSPDALLAEAPTVFEARSGETFACWRELNLYIGTSAIDWPWTGHCRVKQDGEWQDIGFPAEMVYPMWEAALNVDDSGRLLVAWPDNPSATTYNDTRAWIRLWRWSADAGWQGTTDGPGAVFPTDASLAWADGHAWVAFARSDLASDGGQDPGRYTRHISVQRVAFAADGGETWNEAWRTWNAPCPDEAGCTAGTPTADTDGNDYDRMESPAILARPEGLELAYLGFNDAGNTILLTTSDTSGTTWSVPTRLDSSGRVFGHVRPRWQGTKIYWARLGDSGTAEVCRASSADDVACVDTGSPRIRGLAPTTDGATVSVDTGAGSWELQTVTW
jgi:hypothetical protein